MDAAGGHGIIIPERRAAGISPGAIRASAGALMHLPVARVVNIPRTIEYLNTLGLQTVALTADGDTDYTTADLTIPTAIVVGSEEKGVARLTQETLHRHHLDTHARPTRITECLCERRNRAL